MPACASLVKGRHVQSFFMFATGIENSAPTIHGGRKRVDEMEKCGHYGHWRQDFELVNHLGIRFLRYGPHLHATCLAPNRWDWSFADEAFAALRTLDIGPIAELCTFGVPDWIGDFQNPDVPALFAEHPAFAHRFPWVQLYTPINEIFICASCSAPLGWWNEQLSSDRAFVTALKHFFLSIAVRSGAGSAALAGGFVQERNQRC